MLPEPSNNLIEQPPRHSHDEPYVVLPDAHSNNDLCDASLSPVNLPTHSSHVDPNLAHTETDACDTVFDLNVYLPLSTWLAQKLLQSENIAASDPPIMQKLARSLTWYIIRELASLEDVFIRSSIYRLFKRLTHSILPISSVYPFMASLFLGAIQVRKLWIWQRPSLVQAFITLGPILNTIHTLSRLQHNDIPTRADKNEVRRWLSYWLIYISVLNFEHIKARPNTSSSSQIYPNLSIYAPSTVQATSSYLATASRAWYASRAFLQHALHTHLLRSPTTTTTTNIHTRRQPRPFPEPLPHRSRHPGHPDHALFLHDQIFGQNSLIYVLFKVALLKWSSSNTSRGSEQIWHHLISPIVSLTGLSSSSSKLKPMPRREVKLMVVVQPQQAEDISTSHSDLPSQTAQRLSYCIDSQPSIRRVRSDPIPSVCSSPDQHPSQHAPQKSDDLTEPCRNSPTKRSVLAQDFRTPDNAWDTLSYVA